MPIIKCIVVGDQGVGKTSLVTSYTTLVTEPAGDPSTKIVFDCYTAYDTANRISTTLNILDFSERKEKAQQELDRLRPLSYPQTDVFLICFSLIDRDSLDGVRTKWYPEISHFLPVFSRILVGLKLDLRDEQQDFEKAYHDHCLSPVQYEEGLSLSKEIGAAEYFECSANSQIKLLRSKGVGPLFDAVIRIPLNPPWRRRTSLIPACIVA